MWTIILPLQVNFILKFTENIKQKTYSEMKCGANYITIIVYKKWQNNRILVMHLNDVSKWFK